MYSYQERLIELNERVFENNNAWYRQVHTPLHMIDREVNTANINQKGKIAVLLNIEFVYILINKYNINPKNITFFGDCDIKKDVMQSLGCKYYDISVLYNLEEKINMKFDYVVKNSPWDRGMKGLTGKLPFKKGPGYTIFQVLTDRILKKNGLSVDILPANFMCLWDYRGYRKWYLDNFEIKNFTIWDNSDRQVFDVNMSDVVTIISKKTTNPDNTKVEWKCYDSDPFTVDLTLYSIWPMYKSKLSADILKSVMTSKVKDISGDANKIEPNKPFISANLSRGMPRQNANPQRQFQKDVLKDIGYPIWLEYSSEKEKNMQYEWMGTNHYAYVLSMIQSTPKNQPFLFGLIGEHNFKDNQFDKHFKVTKEQNKEIEQWYKIANAAKPSVSGKK